MIIKNWKNQLLSNQSKKQMSKQLNIYFMLAVKTLLLSNFVLSTITVKAEETFAKANNSVNELTIQEPNIVEKASTQLSPSSNLIPNEQNRIQARLKENPWLFLHPYEASYQITSDGEELGLASRRMWFNDGLWQLEISSKLKKWLLTLKSNEHSQFKLLNKELLTTHFLSSTKISFKKPREIEQNFDWDKKVETGRKNSSQWELPINELIYDRMSHILKLRADLLINKNELNYIISYKGKRKVYQYERSIIEKLNTPMGEFNTVRVNRISGDDGSFSIWLSPELNYFPVKIAQFEQDKPDVILTLNNLDFSSIKKTK
ncbi:DUF3108 domain-containing protein [Aliikangiella sp. IMCC44359]|uniref:DUF3108 domain-containing protein n=1 Tax=Aliikangiella sp. IMCC44359 TaxID=3459125 RepID=UPI00403AD8C8